MRFSFVALSAESLESLESLPMRTIFHMDLDAFFCALEEQRDPSLRGQAFAVGGQADQRGVVASCSYAARRFGVRSAMPMARAMSLCPNLIRVPARHDVYRATSNQVMALLHTMTPLVEQLSIDEAFLDVTALLPPSATPDAVHHRRAHSATDYEAHSAAHALAQQLQQRIQQELGLSASLGVASNKLIAKIASDHGKALYAKADAERTHGQPHSNGTNSPRAIFVVPAGEEAAFLAPLPASSLWGVGPKTEAALAALGLVTIGDIAAYPAQELMRRLGQHGYDLSRHARGVDTRPIVTSREVKSISSETTFVRDVAEWDLLGETLGELLEDVVSRLQKHRMQATTVKLKLRWSDFTTLTRQMTLSAPTDQASLIRAAAETLLLQLGAPLRTQGTPVRLLGVGVTGLSSKQQLSLWDVGVAASPTVPPVAVSPVAVSPADGITADDPAPLEQVCSAEPDDSHLHHEKQRRLLQTIQVLEQRFGAAIVQRGCDIQQGHRGHIRDAE